MNTTLSRPLTAILLLALVLTACRDAGITAPVAGDTPLEPPSGGVHVTCTVVVRSSVMRCSEPPPAPTDGALAAPAIIGGQDLYVRLANTQPSYDAGTEIFQVPVTVQNLTRHVLGTSDGVATEGVQVFFHAEPAVTSGTGTVTVANADGFGAFTGTDQPYFLYAVQLAPYEISGDRTWRFSVPNTVDSFGFSVYVSAPVVEEGSPLLDRVWTGADGSAWADAGNWRDDALPHSASTVAIPGAAFLAGSMPVLAADVEVNHIRVGTGSTLALDGHTLAVWGNADVPGAITGGTLSLSGTDRLLGGNIPALSITGSYRLQGGVAATGAVAVADGTLTVRDESLTIVVP